MPTLKEKGVELLRRMLEIRESDKREAIYARQGRAWSQVPHTGHEGLTTVSFLLEQEDWLFAYYRGGHHFSGKGMPRREVALEFFGRRDSWSEGRSHSQNVGSTEVNVLACVASTASQCLPACGAAWGQQIRGKGVTLCSIGEGATREGDFYEAICFAVQKQLPIVFLVEDNGLAISTRTQRMNPFRIGVLNQDFVEKVDGRLAHEVWPVAQAAIEKARKGEGPTVIWAEIDRNCGHTVDEDHMLYRTQDEVGDFADPVDAFAAHLRGKRLLSKTKYEALVQEVADEIEQIYDEAEKAPLPDKATVYTQLYGPVGDYAPVPIDPPKQKTTMVTEINRILSAGLKHIPEMIMFGEDIEDPKGGVFGFTKGLSSAYPGRVINSPLAESTIIGTGVGMGMSGFRPVFEIQFIDFITPGYDQLVSHVSTMRWRTAGKHTVPLVMYAPYGAYLPAGGPWHSQSNDGIFAHLPGLRVACPGTPEDAVGLFWSAFKDEDPSLILIPKHLFRMRRKVETFEPVTWGTGRVVREGSDVTLVSWGNGVEQCELAAADLAEDGVSCEVIDLRTIVPCDYDLIEQSLAKTGRLVVVHEANKTCGFGGTVVTEMVQHVSRFESLLAPPRLLAREDTHIPYHPDLEMTVLPTTDDVIEAIEALMAY